MTREKHPISAESPPNTTDYINLSDYAYYAHTTNSLPYSETGLEADIGFKPIQLPGHLDYNANDGFYGEAFVSTGSGPKQIIVAFEGTNFFTGYANFTAGQIIDDAEIYAGRNAPSYADALAFTHQVINYADAKMPKATVYLTGHSLGAADAEYVATKTRLSGQTFGAPGIPTKDIAGAPTSKLTNYVEDADPVGNYHYGSPIGTPDKNNDPTIVINKNIEHYGGQVVTGTDYLDLLPDAATDYAKGTDSGFLDAATNLAAGLYSHQLSQYACDLDVSLYIKDKSLYGTDPTGAGFALNGFSSATPNPTVASPSLQTASAACFVAGTLILTPHGEVAIETLRAGDRVLTAAGIERHVRWLGHRTVDCRRHEDPTSVWPIRIAAGAFGANGPSRDLSVSPGHAICVDVVGEALIPAAALCTDGIVAQVAMDTVTYWHLELDSHDIIVADGLACESYLDTGNRGFFVESALVALDATPDRSDSWQAGLCRPYCDTGPIVDAARARLPSIRDLAPRAREAACAGDKGPITPRLRRQARR